MAVGMTGKGHGTLVVKHCGVTLMAKVKSVEETTGSLILTYLRSIPIIFIKI